MIEVTRVGHACVLLELDGVRILTDPWFSERKGYHPGEGPGIALADLPRLDAVLVSHGHYDHYDMEAFAAYPDRSVPVLVKNGTAAAARRAGFENVTELDWWQEARVGDVRVLAAPARHGVPENTFVLESPSHVVYFAADTLLIPELAEVGRRFPRIDLMLVSTNGLRLKPLLNRKVVMDAEDAARLCALLRPETVIPMHYAFEARDWFHDAFLISYERGPERFAAACRRLAPEVRVCVAEPGRRVQLPGRESVPAAGRRGFRGE
jgi:L-ascorbate metabolism protein UlaG (beta-lactamase superfamily)